MVRHERRRRVTLLAGLLAAALLWRADVGIRAAASDRAEKSVAPARTAETAVTGTTAKTPPPAKPVKADATAKVDTTAAETATVAADAEPAPPDATAVQGQRPGPRPVPRPVPRPGPPQGPRRGQDQDKGKEQVTRDDVYPVKFQKLAPSEIRAAAVRAAKAGMKPGRADLPTGVGVAGDPIPPPVGLDGPGGIPHYFGPYGNFAFSPLPKGPLGNGGLTILDGGSGYHVNDLVPVVDAYRSGTLGVLRVSTVTPGGAITGLVVDAAGQDYFAPVVDFENVTPVGGSGAVASVTLDPLLVTGGLQKFIDPLPGLWDPRNGQPTEKAIPIGVPDVVTYPGSDYYEIELVEYEAIMHSQLPPTRLRGYRQVNLGTNASCTPDVNCTPAHNIVAPPLIPYYLGPVIVAKGKAVGVPGAPGKPRPVR
ncbi:MAG TPA: hypothetical protein VES73_11760, partial [Lamprocystis sp. (in: g-proteobacteria)]|nr:hypothetical protein [Lamprocystis sp. (in: g-proteobacteria)]